MFTPPTPKEEGIPNRIIAFIHHMGLTQMDVARKLRMMGAKTSGSLISLWCTGDRKASFYSLAALSMLHDQPALCLRWLQNGGDMPRLFSFPQLSKSRGLARVAEPANPLTADGREMLQTLVHALEYTLRSNDVDYQSAKNLTTALLKMAEALEEAGADATHLWQALSYIKVREAEARRQPRVPLHQPAPILPPAPPQHHLPPAHDEQPMRARPFRTTPRNPPPEDDEPPTMRPAGRVEIDARSQAFEHYSKRPG